MSLFSPSSATRRLAVVALALLPAVTLLMLQDTPLHSADGEPAALEIRSGDHVCFIGNTLADRMQHDGWLEAYLHSRFPTFNLTIRNLGYSGDELTTRLRSMDFGKPDEWLSGSSSVPQPRKLNPGAVVSNNRFEKVGTRADVVFAFFGYNESHAGEAGLAKFKKDLDDFIQHTLAQKYNGKSPPRLVLFSPIAHEYHKSPHLPDGRANNERIALYTKAMAEVARSRNVPFLDLFKPTADLYEKAARPLTINGIHLAAEGNRQLAEVIDRGLFQGEIQRDPKNLEKLRQAVLDKNFFWYQRYRATDGYSTFGDRAFLRFKPDDQSNYEVVQRELEAIDVLTGNRDRRIWAVARGEDLKVDDRNLPDFIPVKTNKPGPLPGGKHLFLDGEEAIQKMRIAPGMKVSLFASEKQFRELVNPVQMSFDPKGRLWVAVWPTYPHWKPMEPMNDKLLIVEDTDGDGKADKVSTFADGLHNPTGFEFWGGGVLVAQAPDLVFLKDTDGDGKADVRQRMVHGLDTADTHHTSNSFVLDPGGAVYFQEGTFHQTQVETPYGSPQRCSNAGVYRYEPRTQKFDVYITFGFANPHGHVFDRWGQDIVVDGTGANPFHAALFSGHLPYPQKHGRPPQVYQQRTRPCPGMEYLSSRHFPPEMDGNLLVANVIGDQGILRYKIEDKDASFAGVEQQPVLMSSDPNFRPTDLKIGPDGAIWFIDWQNPIIGHMQHNLRDPSRDREHGRIYRVTYEGRELSKPVAIAGEPVEKVLDVLKQPQDRVRYRARIELSGRDATEVIPAVQKWIAGLDDKDENFEHHLLEGLWVHQNQNVIDTGLLNRVLAAKDFRARAAATRVLCYWHDRVPESLELFKKLAADEHPRVRLEAVRAASFFAVPEALEVVLISQEKPGDVYLDFTRGETMKALDPFVKKAIAEGKTINFTTAAGARYFLRTVSTDDLLKMKRTQGVYLELLFRKGVRDEFRREALVGLAKQDGKSEMAVLLDAIRNQDEQGVQDESVVFDLVRLMTDRGASALSAVRPELEKMAMAAKMPLNRELGYIALIAADGSTDKAWTLGTKSVAALQDLLSAMPLVRDPVQRASLYPKVEPLLKGLPRELAPAGGDGKRVLGRFVRIELPGRQRTLTLAEVEVFSGGQNLARSGRTSQKNTAHGGDASRAVDGNKNGSFGQGGQTHTEEGTGNPWWEVDLKFEVPVESIVVYNRTDGNLGSRLKGFTIKVLNERRGLVFEKRAVPAPDIKVAFEVSSEAPQRAVRRAAMTALTAVRSKYADTFTTLAKFLADDAERPAAVSALLRIPAKDWPKDQAKPTLDVVLAAVRKVPAKDRTSPAVLDLMTLGDGLASLLPLAEARAVRKELGELGVRVIRLAAPPEQMRYDLERFAVRAGKPVEVVFTNTDFMPHNFVITQPGAMEEIGNLAEAQATQPGAAARHYVPKSSKILHSGILLQPREQQQISFTAPTKPGVYPYVCTYPGHWRRMYGAMYVVEDLDEYQADPEGYLTKHPLAIADELLKFVRPRTEWKFDDLVSSLEHLGHGRSYATGKQMFQVGACVSCHKLEGTGNEFGPDLTKLDPKWKVADILKHILEPSFQINEKFQTWAFTTKSGKTLTGLVLEETADTVKLIENPLVKAEPVILKKSQIEERTKTPTSTMPKGLLDKLTREEILDLMAYVVSGGNSKHMLFHDHHH